MKAIAVTVGVLAVAAAAVAALADRHVEDPQTAYGTSTVSVEKRALNETVTARGTLTYAGKRVLGAGVAGTVTALPKEDGRVGPGDELYRIDNEPVTLFTGTLPAWRAFESGMGSGPDVTQLEASLTALGYFHGVPDESFDWYTTAAVREWQQNTGQPVTGSIPLGRMVFGSSEMRTGQLSAQVGVRVQPGDPIMTLSETRKVVVADVKPSDQTVAITGAEATVNVPGGRSVRGTVASVAPPREVDRDGAKSLLAPVIVIVDDDAQVAELHDVAVSVDFSRPGRTEVLAVPVSALIALPGGGFGVQVPLPDGTASSVPVQTGRFAGGFVEVTGEGVDVGTEVVVPSL
ncbi:MAG: peptidoglycan-binding protein [Rhodococcus sp. (in: high G+C Gram-positive bacteria)]|uniref:efflux RND transporter periplasmic adaptor subunit n=1 Tax=Rhodococcus sp. TaxID=1831 RepID=UPI003BB5F108